MALMQLPETESYFHKVMLLSGTLRLDSRKIGYEKAQNFSEIIAENYPNSTIDSLTTENIMNIMNLDQTTRGQSKGLELIYAPIQ
ncbi:carboxylesterase/lipase family protein, partial [Staphylococcus epidermidis]